MLLTAGCSAHYVDYTAPERALAETGQPDEALKALSAKAEEAELDPLLVAVDRGGILHRAGRYRESAGVLNEAARLADERETVSLSEELFGRAPWRMGTLERQALHAINALNYLQLGEPDEAVVEARLTDSLHLQARIEAHHREAFERSIHFAGFDETVRVYLERLVIGRYISGLAHELAGNEDSAFIDYYDALLISRQAPPGAPAHVAHVIPWLLREGERLQRPELSQLRAWYPEAKPAEPAEGELVVIIEAGRIPERVIEKVGDYGYWTVGAREWSRARARVEIASQDGGEARVHVAETVTSLENLLLRRGGLGALTDTERSESLAVNTGVFFTYLLLPPVGATLLIKRVYESTIRMGQGWLTLPAEFQVVRRALTPGRQNITVRLGEARWSGEVRIESGKPTVVVVPLL